MVWIERTADGQKSIKLRGMEKPVEWSDDGIAQTTKDDAELLVENGSAEYRDHDSHDSAGDEDEGDEQDQGDDQDLEDEERAAREALAEDEAPEPSHEHE